MWKWTKKKRCRKKKQRREQHELPIGFGVYGLKPELLQAIMDCGFEHPSEGLKIKGKLKKNIQWKLIYSFSSST